jgi:hypothetical protein
MLNHITLFNIVKECQAKERMRTSILATAPDDNYPQKSPNRLLAQGLFLEGTEKARDLSRS